MNLTLTILNPTGLHARPGAIFAATAKKFKSAIQIRNLTKDGDWSDAKSVLGVLKLGAENGHQIELSITGEDEAEAAQTLRRVVENGLGESVTGVALQTPSAVQPSQPPANDRQLRGVPGAPGIAIGPVQRWQEQEIAVPRRAGCHPAIETAKLDTACAAAQVELEQLESKVTRDASASEAAIFAVHRMFLEDPDLLQAARGEIQRGVNAEAAWMDAVTQVAERLAGLSDPTIAARAADIRDVGQRVLAHLLGRAASAAFKMTQPGILLARDLTPSQTASLDKALVLAFCTAEGGPTSHSAILARALQLPAVVGLGDALLQMPDGETIIVDGGLGQITLRPLAAELEAARQEKARQAGLAQLAFSEAARPAISLDGRRVEVVANIGDVADARQALEFGAEGVGLLRTEFLYLQRETAPDEQDQYEAYRAIFEVFGSRPVVVRTLDIGGDKMLPYLDLGQEDNPFLGWRAIRICLNRPDIFQPQLRALLRAAQGHDIRIMFPMIAALQEIRAAKDAVAQAAAALKTEGAAFTANVQLGMMVEIPSAAIMADLFAREVDFFSIGTNDLTQYTMAAERTNKRVAYLGDAIHPAILRLIRQVTEAAHAAGKWVGVCGELGGDALALPILLGLGIDELSMTPAMIPQAKAVIRQWHTASAAKLAAEVLSLDTAQAVRAKVQNWPKA